MKPQMQYASKGPDHISINCIITSVYLTFYIVPHLTVQRVHRSCTDALKYVCIIWTVVKHTHTNKAFNLSKTVRLISSLRTMPFIDPHYHSRTQQII